MAIARDLCSRTLREVLLSPSDAVPINPLVTLVGGNRNFPVRTFDDQGQASDALSLHRATRTSQHDALVSVKRIGFVRPVLQGWRRFATAARGARFIRSQLSVWV